VEGVVFTYSEVGLDIAKLEAYVTEKGKLIVKIRILHWSISKLSAKWSDR